jgi:hypothetical protein
MDNLPAWAVWIAAGAVGVAPGLAILSAPMIARIIHRVLSPRRGMTPKPQPERTPEEPAAISVPRGGRGAGRGTDCGAGNGQHLSMEPRARLRRKVVSATDPLRPFRLLRRFAA